ncbi:substrate-binding periplasmic protein [Photobacterium rosenbergii]|uniref:substrate-binding periplasmic protein n=1 Tax=Photobacterium rosenbergii TaxID=294936 RepID=UPI00191C6F55|nr:transporter substrate-binding domain-containing protein [Photobacterium rosenbergii]
MLSQVVKGKPFQLLKGITLVGVCLTCSTAWAVDRVVLATQNWSPYQTVNSDGDIGGVAVDRIKCTFRNMGQPYEIRMMRWDKAQLLVETGKVHGFFSGSANAKRASYAQASDPIVSENLAWFVSPAVRENINDETAKYSLRYGVKYNTNKWLSLKRDGYNVIKKPRDADSLLQMLWQGELDVAYEYELVFEEAMDKAGIPKDYFKKIRTSKQDLMVHFSKGFLAQQPSFLNRFNLAMAQCR